MTTAGISLLETTVEVVGFWGLRDLQVVRGVVVSFGQVENPRRVSRWLQTSLAPPNTFQRCYAPVLIKAIPCLCISPERVIIRAYIASVTGRRDRVMPLRGFLNEADRWGNIALSLSIWLGVNRNRFRGVLRQAAILALLGASLTTLASSVFGQGGTFVPTGSLNTARSYQTATVLNNGKVLIAGGVGSSLLVRAELYDPSNGAFTTTGSLNTARYFHTATLLNNGKVLIAGGVGGETPASNSPPNGILASAELYDPTTGTSTTTGSLNTARVATASLLNNGTVLIAGGTGSSELASAELYSPATGVFSLTGSLNTARTAHTASLLNNGTVLIAGGQLVSAFVRLASAELYELVVVSPTSLPFSNQVISTTSGSQTLTLT